MSINDIPTNANDNNPEEYYEVFCPEVLLTTWNMLASSLCLVGVCSPISLLCVRPLQVHKKYDLKGSTVDREASDKEKQKKEPTLKDMDFLNDGAKVKIGDEAKEKLLETLSADVEFLTKNDIMDYSLLLGIHDTKQAVEDDRDAEEEEEDEDEEYDSGGSGVALTPPESPGLRVVCIWSLRCLQTMILLS